MVSAIVAATPSIHPAQLHEKTGKSAAVNRAVQQSRNGILVFSDANTLLNRQALVNIKPPLL